MALCTHKFRRMGKFTEAGLVARATVGCPFWASRRPPSPGASPPFSLLSSPSSTPTTTPPPRTRIRGRGADALQPARGEVPLWLATKARSTLLMRVW